jgi:hypothetical protein
MADQFSQSKTPGGLGALEEKILGPSYDYAGHIKSPSELDMRSDGNFGALADDVGGLLAYVDVLVGGQGDLACGTKNLDGSDYCSPLGNQFFLDTPVKCKDIATKQKVTRSIYINNIPDGSVPLVTEVTGVSFDDFKGIMPGIMSNIAQIKPMQILNAFVSGPSAACQKITMPTMDSNNNPGVDHRYVTNIDISNMPGSWFAKGVPPKNSYNLKEPEGFCNHGDVQGVTNSSLPSTKVDYSKMPNDIVIRFYYSTLGLLGLYILLRLMLRKK